jgi:hydrophobe/amphiphile efflux-1 (HAE1) family protein
MILSDVSIKRPVFTAMVILALMSLGLLAFRSIGVDQFPDVSFPIVVVNTVYPGAGPEEIEQQVSKPLEEALSSLNGIDKVRSFSRDSMSTVMLEFKLETDVKAASSDVRERMAAVRFKLPKDIRDPIIQRFDPSSLPILTFVVSSSRHPSVTRQLTEDLIKPRLEAIDGVASVTVLGGLEREVKVFLDRGRLDALGLSMAGIAQQLGQDGFDLPAGRVTTNGTELNLKTEGRYRTLADLGNVVVASLVNGDQVRLADVARIEDGFKDVRTRTRLDGAESVTFEIQKQSGTNTVAIADKVDAAVAKLATVLPADVQLLKAIDGAANIKRDVHAVTEDIVLGGLAAILIIFLFMLDWRSTLISSLSLPTSVVTTFLVMGYLGFTFNMMSLLALSLSIGLLIDDAVVVRENIFRHMEMGKDPITAAREGTNEIGLAVMATTFTIVAVFVPVGFMGGVVGKFFRQFGLTVAAAVLVSLFVSFTLDPMMSARVMKPIEPGHHERLKHHRFFGPIVRFYDGLDAYYRGVLAWALDHKKLVAAGATGLFFGSLLLTSVMGKEFVSPSDRGEFRVKLELPAGTSFAETDRLTKEAEAAIRRASPFVKSLFTTVGAGEESHRASVRVYTVKSKERPGVSQWDIQGLIRTELGKLPNLRYAVADIGMIEGGDESPVSIMIRGEDYGAMQEYAQTVKRTLASVRGAADVDVSYRAGKPETAVRVDRAKAADLGIAPVLVAQTLRLAVEGEVVAKYRDAEREIDVRVQLPPEERVDPAGLGELHVPASLRRLGNVPGDPMAGMAMQGRLVKVGQVAEIRGTTGPAVIERENRQRQILVTANLTNRALGDVVNDFNAKLVQAPPPPGVVLLFGGQTERMRETFGNMLLAIGTAVLFIFFVLASQFESFVHPFTIMIALPLALVGALGALFLANFPIGMPAMIGIIMLMGLATKNAILLVDYTNELRDKGLRMKDALLEAGPTRLRPILMTSMAMVLGMLPPALATGDGSEFKASMAVAVIGGVIASTVLTLIVVPIVYTWFDNLTLRGRQERREEREARAKERKLAPVPRPVADDGRVDDEPGPMPAPVYRS